LVFFISALCIHLVEECVSLLVEFDRFLRDSLLIFELESIINKSWMDMHRSLKVNWCLLSTEAFARMGLV